MESSSRIFSIGIAPHEALTATNPWNAPSSRSKGSAKIEAFAAKKDPGRAPDGAPRNNSSRNESTRRDANQSLTLGLIVDRDAPLERRSRFFSRRFAGSAALETRDDDRPAEFRSDRSDRSDLGRDDSIKPAPCDPGTLKAPSGVAEHETIDSVIL